jgi:CRISPR-associated exonuclease Cas4
VTTLGHEDSLLPLSALQHFAYCPRQFALIHVEQEWAENRFTAEGQVLHRRVDEGDSEQRGDFHVARSLRLVCSKLGVSGVADVVEFHQTAQGGCELPGYAGRWQPYPVEYKRGRSKVADWDRIQLCAQAMALEEMLGVAVPEGALFYGKPRRRERVVIGDQLREASLRLAAATHALFNSGRSPPPEYGPKCDDCSMREICVPDRSSAKTYLQRMLDT